MRRIASPRISASPKVTIRKALPSRRYRRRRMPSSNAVPNRPVTIGATISATQKLPVMRAAV